MNSINFEMLRDQSPELATLGGFAEKYAYKDPSSALIKLRTLTKKSDRVFKVCGWHSQMILLWMISKLNSTEW